MTTPPKKTGTPRRKRSGTPISATPDASNASNADNAIQTKIMDAITSNQDSLPEPDLTVAHSPEPDPVTAQTAEAELSSTPPPLVGEFISREDWADTPHHNPVSDEDIRPGSSENAVVDRVKHLNRNMGWVLISAGLVGIVIPGVIGTPFVILGSLVLWPGNQKLLDKWRRNHRSRFVDAALRQVDRYLDDIERRYPTNDKPR